MAGPRFSVARRFTRFQPGDRFRRHALAAPLAAPPCGNSPAVSAPSVMPHLAGRCHRQPAHTGPAGWLSSRRPGHGRTPYLSPQQGTLSGMASLQTALAATDGLREARKPPGLRDATGEARCATCRYYRPRLMSGAGVCRLYAGYPVHADNVSDAYQKRGT